MRLVHFLLTLCAWRAVDANCPGNCQICFFQYVCNLNYPATWTVSGTVSEIPTDSFQNGANLQTLTMSFLNIQTIHNDSLVGLTNLEYLDLSHNSLTTLPAGVFQPLVSLVSLDLSSNQLSQLQPYAMTGLNNLETLYVSDNNLTSLSSELLMQLPQLTTIVLKGNSWSCQCNSTLMELVTNSTTARVDGEVLCSTPLDSAGTAALLYYHTHCLQMTSTPVVSETPSISTTSTSSFSSTTTASTTTTTSVSSSLSLLTMAVSTVMITPSPSSPSPSTSALPSLLPSPSPLPTCLPSLTESASGVYSWPAGLVSGQVAILPCSYGPFGAVAKRECGLHVPSQNPQWELVDDTNCSDATTFLQLLSEIEITPVNVVQVAAALAQLPFNHLTRSDIVIFAQTATEILNSGLRLDEMVLRLVVQAVDSALNTNSAVFISQDRQTANQLHQAISTGLLNALNVNNSELVLQYTNLLVGGSLIGGEKGGDSVVAMVSSRGVLFTSNTSNTTQLIIAYHNTNDTQTQVIQVTVYKSTQLFSDVKCSVSGSGREVCVNGTMLLTPIAVVTTTNGAGTVDITYERVMISPNSLPECVVWNSSTNEGAGGWSAVLCDTIYYNTTVMCNCNSTNLAVTVIEVNQNTTNATNTTTTIDILYRAVFYSCSGVAVIIHLPLMLSGIVVCFRHKYVRSVQALVGHTVSQCLVFLIMVLSLERWPIDGVCFTLGLLLHYTILVSYFWLIIRSIVVVLRETRRQMYERNCFIMPFIILAWAIPIIPVMIYAIISVTRGLYELDICWLENGDFPSYFTYVAVLSVAIVTLNTMICLFVLVFSGYTVSNHSYVEITSLLVELALFSAAVGMQFVTATVTENRAIFLVITGGVVLTVAIYFYFTNGLLRQRVRQVLICKQDKSKKKEKPAPSKMTHLQQRVSRVSRIASDASQVSDRSQYRRAGVRYTDEMNLDYIGEYLEPSYPLAMYQQMNYQQHDRRVRRGPRAQHTRNKPTSSEA